MCSGGVLCAFVFCFFGVFFFEKAQLDVEWESESSDLARAAAARADVPLLHYLRLRYQNGRSGIL